MGVSIDTYRDISCVSLERFVSHERDVCSKFRNGEKLSKKFAPVSAA